MRLRKGNRKRHRNRVPLQMQGRHDRHHQRIRGKLLLHQSRLQRLHHGEKEKTMGKGVDHIHTVAATGTIRDDTMGTENGDNFS